MRAEDLTKLKHLLHDVEWTPEELALVDQAIYALEAPPAQPKPTLASLFGQEENKPPEKDVALHFVIPTPMSSKNTQKLAVVPGGKRGLGTPRRYRPKEVQQMTEYIQATAVKAMRAQAPQAYAERRPLFRDEDVRVEMVHNVHDETVDVLVRYMGPKQKGMTGRRRDVHNLPELVCDAIQKIAFKNDNQVCDLRVFRNVSAPTNRRD